ncbi:hypothetical protein ABH15_07505 [Methanoculleus taiwanensis]|uniref:Uncharacterized protein n=1 Tax=Methanoculleus taiwanensis TaxID=1550565 RepID=A0A498H077_9EURY|nr:hypothetical protein [Methanoculleus taiwanensis]RXE56033.1 hypothetical protein ABH15_07505 [Methanoculleus taiwanensis]
MADFVEKSNTKTAVRELSLPIADVSTFDAIVGSVLADNPFGCVDYIESGVTYDGVTRNRESYTAKVNYEDNDGKRVGAVSARAPSVAAFGSVATEIMGDAALAAAMGGDAVRDAEHDSYSCQLKCHDPSGEIYYVTLSRNAVRITSYQDDAIRTTVETWADGVPALG